MYKKNTAFVSGSNRYAFTLLIRVMKLTGALLLLAVFQLQATSYAQKVSLHMKNARLEDLFFEIKQQSGYDFLYKAEVLDKARPVSLSVDNASLHDVLASCLANQALTYQIHNKTISIQELPNSTLQEITVSGVVTDTAGNPLPAVSILEKGQKRGTTSDDQGRFVMKITSDRAMLLISSVGYETQEFPLNKRTSIIVKLRENSAELSEVVVVGYGTQKKINLTGSVASIQSSEIVDQPTPNLTNVVAGRLPGVIATNPNGRPGSGSNLSIRGISTLNNNSPLVVIDGVIRSDGFSAIDANDVESITVLKDAAAAAVYGARAANGVFLITTKRGKLNKPVITYSGLAGLQSPTFYPKLMSATEYARIRNQGLRNQGYDINNPAQSSLFFSEQQLSEFEQGINTVNWYDESFKKNSMQTQHSLTINGGSEAIRYFSSVGYYGQDGMFDHIDYKRYNFRANIDATVNKNLTVGLNLEGRQEDQENPGFDANEIFHFLIRNRPTTPAYTPSGRPFNTTSEHPVEMIRSSGYNNSTYDIFLGTLSFDYQLSSLVQGLSLKGLASVYREVLSQKKFFTPYSMYNEDTEGNVTGEKVVGGQTSLYQQSNRRSNYTLNVALNYNRTFNKHDIGGLLLYEQYESEGNNLNATRQDFVSNIKDEMFASGPANQTIGGYSFLDDARQSIVGRFNYAYDSRYLLEASFRYDGSYRFAPGRRFGFFPAISAGWRISDESFFKQAAISSLIENLKLRASHGIIGNDRVDAFQYADMYTLNTSEGPVVGGVAVPNISYGVYPNPTITWETQQNTNFGIEASFLKEAIALEFDYFFRTTSDILWSRERSIPETFGRTLSNENYAEIVSLNSEG
ncbi:SusC/RagA family TonB-linked outer membrane protein [Olivibacter sp. XZL3]|uniref:SusC/RagA family TonB-linked outer membrane protein n=1 Tax=Olivibacter sp. XZL3 TaxID=1735116 RepID=UPI0010658A6F|nr:SusC/RagA family TonB-linked outer membrane protein [Olivibacter sp. XZL3]